MSIPWEEHYIYKLRTMVDGKLPLIVPSIKTVIRDNEGKILFIERRKPNIKHTNSWGLIAGSIEPGESIYDCMKREVKEEAGLDVISATLFSIYTGPEGLSEKGQLFEFCFRVDEWSGTLLTETEESTDARFFPLHELPLSSHNEFWERHNREVIHDFMNYDGQLILK
ncbi:NUDIX domain-containing protein [Paenibacillus sp. UNC451MF]|uniref:NUDIX domain-containing protein n=1 Tax=Paenibacillus sp. UNC451MF TaxID=1449063 RepID=UPI00068CD167|nr:NUDIX domain-containing protein [Paenibacillus sp. UNC451MF]